MGDKVFKKNKSSKHPSNEKQLAAKSAANAREAQAAAEAAAKGGAKKK